MSNQKVSQKPYRIEERHTAGSKYGIDFDTREEADAFWRLRMHSAVPAGSYRPDAPHSLVLLGPDRTRLAPSVVEGPAL